MGKAPTTPAGSSASPIGKAEQEVATKSPSPEKQEGQSLGVTVVADPSVVPGTAVLVQGGEVKAAVVNLSGADLGKQAPEPVKVLSAEEAALVKAYGLPSPEVYVRAGYKPEHYVDAMRRELSKPRCGSALFHLGDAGIGRKCDLPEGHPVDPNAPWAHSDFAWRRQAHPDLRPRLCEGCEVVLMEERNPSTGKWKCDECEKRALIKRELGGVLNHAIGIEGRKSVGRGLIAVPGAEPGKRFLFRVEVRGTSLTLEQVGTAALGTTAFEDEWRVQSAQFAWTAPE